MAPLILSEPSIDSRDVRVAVVKHLTDHLKWNPCLGHPRAYGATKVVNRDTVESSTLTNTLPRSLEVFTVIGAVSGENPVTVVTPREFKQYRERGFREGKGMGPA